MQFLAEIADEDEHQEPSSTEVDANTDTTASTTCYSEEISLQRKRTHTAESGEVEDSVATGNDSMDGPIRKRSRQDRAAMENEQSDMKEPPYSSAFQAGKADGRPKLSDYSSTSAAIILRAIHDYECRILSQGAFPETVIRNGWAESSFRKVCRVAKVDFIITNRIIKLVCILCNE